MTLSKSSTFSFLPKVTRLTTPFVIEVIFLAAHLIIFLLETIAVKIAMAAIMPTLIAPTAQTIQCAPFGTLPVTRRKIIARIV